MTTDLWMLVWSALLCLMMPTIYLVGEVQTPGGMEWGLGNRDTPLAMPAWAERAKRAHGNLLENLPAFAILVLVAHVSGHANGTTALGAQIFFWARLVYAGVYTAGITVVRTVVYFAGTLGQVMILSQLF